MANRFKLFAGIELNTLVRSKCAQITARLAAMGLNARFEPEEKLHITLAFLGWVDVERADTIHDALHAASNAARPFTLTLDTIGAFPHERRPKIIWIGARDQGHSYSRLAYAARAAFEPLGFSFEKDAVAHVTIARVKGGNAHLPMLDVSPIHVHVTEIALFESLPDGVTTRYEVLHRFKLNPNV